MNKFPHFSAMIFDMDGLVLDTETTYCVAWKKAAAELGVEFSTAFCLSMSGLQIHDVEKKLKEKCGVDFDLIQFFSLSGDYWRDYVYQFGIPVKKGFFSLVEVLKLKKIPFCLATNSRKKNVLECLELAELNDIFSIIVSRDDVMQGKPAADIFLYAAKKLIHPISQCLVVEDSSIGIEAASNAKAPSIFIPSVFPYQQATKEQANYLLNDLDELAQIVLNIHPHPV